MTTGCATRTDTAKMLIHCICADWCDTCGEFRPLFDRAAVVYPAHVFAWHVLEDLEERFAQIEVETFPTLLITDNGGSPLFVGPVLPNMAALTQVIAAAQAGGALSRASDLDQWAGPARALAVGTA